MSVSRKKEFKCEICAVLGFFIEPRSSVLIVIPAKTSGAFNLLEVIDKRIPSAEFILNHIPYMQMLVHVDGFSLMNPIFPTVSASFPQFCAQTPKGFTLWVFYSIEQKS